MEALGSKGPERAPRSMGPERKAARRSSAPRGTCWRGRAEKEEELWKPLGMVVVVEEGGGGVGEWSWGAELLAETGGPEMDLEAVEGGSSKRRDGEGERKRSEGERKRSEVAEGVA